MSKGHFLSHHGECHAFDESAAGYARGEGAGVFLIKSYDKAVADGDSIHAVIRGTGVNQDGHTDGISLPNSEAQEQLVRDVYRIAGVSPGAVDYVEAHGTGTQAGDPAELQALDANFSEGRDPGVKLKVGSVKTNVGHLEAAAGVAGMLKAIGVLKHRQVPKNLHFKKPNPKIPFADYCLEVAKDVTPLPGADEKETLFVAVNSFGYGGTNAHVLLESAAPSEEGRGAAADGRRWMIPLSAQSENALRDLAGKYAFLLGQGLPGSIADLAYTAAFRRSHLDYRCAAFAKDTDELRSLLIAASTGESVDGVVSGDGAVDSGAGLVFVYTGMGPQWWAMGQELIREAPLAAATIDEIDAHFTKLAGWSLKEAMLADEASSRMERTELAQTANFALQVALTRLWESYGIRPAAVVGHSVGEVAAAYIAGVYSLEEAILVSYHRSRLQQTMAGQGAMLAVGLPEVEALELIKELPGISIAAVNSFSAVTLSGDTGQLQQLAAELEKREIFSKFLRVEVAYHSPQMDPLRDELYEVLGGLSPKPGRIPLYSAAHGGRIPCEEWNVDYWWRNVRQSVRFADAMSALFDDGYASFLEVGPHPVLGNSIKECAVQLGRKVSSFVSLRRKEPELRRVLQTVGELYCAGFDPDWAALAPREGRFLAGPQYPWQRQRHWIESERSVMERLGLPGPVYLNRTVQGPVPCWEVEINRNYFPFLFDHGVQDQTVFAGMGYVEAALALCQRVHNKSAVMLENVSFERVLIVDYSKLQVLLTAFDPETGRFGIFSRIEGEENSVQRHCRGRMLPQSGPRAVRVDLGPYRAECREPVSVEAFHDRLRRRELFYGPAFTKPVLDVRVGEGSFLVKIDASAGSEDCSAILPPAVFDAALRAVLYCAAGERLFVPFSFEQFHYFSAPSGEDCYACGRLISQSDSLILADVWLTDSEGNVHAHARRLALQAIEMAARQEKDEPFYELDWQPSPLEAGAGVEGSGVLILTDAGDPERGLARELAQALPGAAVERPEMADDSGFAKAELIRVLAAHPGRSRLVVLWGARPGEIAMAPLSGKLIGLLQAIGEERPNDPVDVTIVTRGARPVFGGGDLTGLSAAALSAIALVGQNEFESVMCRAIDFADDAIPAAAILSELNAGSPGDIAYRNGQRFVCVLRPMKKKGETPVSRSVEEPLELASGSSARMDPLRFQSAVRIVPGAGEIELRVHRVAIQEKDLLKLQGHLHPAVLENTFSGDGLGMACAGVVLRCESGGRFAPGDRVVAVAPRAFRTYATVPEGFAVKIPAELDMDAAAIPVDCLTAHRGLVEVARLQPGERVLIHEAATGAGLAAVEIARAIGAEIFATAASGEQLDFLRQRGIKAVFFAGNLDFAQAVQEATNQEGVDVVIGGLPGQAMHASLSLLRTGGRYIETGKRDIAEDRDLPLRAFNRNVLFAAVDIDRLAKERPDLIEKALQAIFERFEAGEFQPGPVRKFPVDRIQDAFGHMAEATRTGSVLLDVSEGDLPVIEKPADDPIVKPDGCYIITGGTSGFGLAAANWMAANGAGRILLASRSGMNAPGIQDAVESIAAHGARVEVCSADVTDPEQVRGLLGRASEAPFVLRGIVHGAMVLDDAMMRDLTKERFERVLGPKADGALHLAECLKGLPDLDFVVFHSSVSAIIGNRAQTSYVAANSMLDALAHRLRAEGIPATSINWGALSESGVVARDEHLGSLLSSAGITGLTDAQAFAAMERILRQSVAQACVFEMDWGRWHEAHPKLADDPRFQTVRLKAGGKGDADTASKVRMELADASKEQRLGVLLDRLQSVLSGVLRMGQDSIPTDRKLNEIGVDSLMVLELGLGIEERIGARFSAMELLKGPTLHQLATMAQNKLWKI